MTIRWITSLLGTAPGSAVRDIPDIHVVDVRDLVDKAGNRVAAVGDKIRKGQALVAEGKKTVVCCDYGISRSNAIAAGILAGIERLSLEEAVRRVIQATGETEIKVELLQAVRAAVGVGQRRGQQSERLPKLVTGGSGFLGTAVTKLLREEFYVLAPARHELDLEKGSAQLDLLVSENKVDLIIHLANPRVYTSSNAMGKALTMLRNVIDVCTATNIPLVFLSSWEIYSGYRGALRADEALPALPRGPYGETKHLCELMIQHAQNTLGLRCAVIRSSPAYGTGSDKPKFLYNFIDKAKRNEPILTHRYANGDPALDLLHVDDLASVIARTVRSKCIGTLNVGTGVTTSTHSIATLVTRMLRSSSKIEQTPIDAECANIAIDYGRARSLLEWCPTITLERGLERILSEKQ